MAPRRKNIRQKCKVCARFVTKSGKCTHCSRRQEAAAAQPAAAQPAAAQPASRSDLPRAGIPPSPPSVLSQGLDAASPSPVLSPPPSRPAAQATTCTLPEASQLSSEPRQSQSSPAPPSPSVVVRVSSEDGCVGPTRVSQNIRDSCEQVHSAPQDARDEEINSSAWGEQGVRELTPDSPADEIFCRCCLCVGNNVINIPRGNVGGRQFSQINPRNDPSDEFPVCATCFNYIFVDNPQPQNPRQNRRVVPDATDSDSGSESSSSDEAAAPPAVRQRGNNRNVVWKFGWKAFLTHFALSSDSVIEFRERLQCIPKAFSDTWSNEFFRRLDGRNRVALVGGRAAVRLVERIVSDITQDIEDFNNKLSTGRLADLRDALDATTVATVRCPYGCAEYIEKTGAIGYNHFLRSQYPSITAFNANSDRYLKGMREDFIAPTTHFGKDVKPCVRITPDFGLVPCTCRDHNKGSPKSYIHAPRNPCGTMPSPHSDQLTPAIFAPKPFRSMRPKYSSHTWQMRQVQGGFSGLSSFSLTTVPRWDIHHRHHHQLQALYYTNRSDLRSFIRSKYANDTEIIRVLDTLEQFPLPGEWDQREALDGATYMDIEQALTLLESMKQVINAVVDELPPENQEDIERDNVAADRVQRNDEPAAGDRDPNPDNDQRRARNVTWPAAYVHAQPYNSSGVSPRLINPFQGKFVPLLWVTLRLISFIPVIWTAVASAEALQPGNVDEARDLNTAKAYFSTFLPVGNFRSVTQGMVGLRGNPTSAQQFILDRARLVHGLLPTQQADNECHHTCVELARFLKSLPFTCVAYVPSRRVAINTPYVESVLATLPDEQAEHDCKLICICTTAARSTQNRTPTPHTRIRLGDSSWELVALVRADGTSASPWGEPEGGTAAARQWGADCFLRNEGPFNDWFKSSRSPVIQQLPNLLREDAYVNWGCLIYVRTSGGYRSESKLRYLQYTGGQGTLICRAHDLPLTIVPILRNTSERKRCSYQDLQSNVACDRVAKWECPKDGCSTCLCRAHGKQYLDQAQNNPQRLYVNPRSGDRNNVQRNLDPFPDAEDDSDGDLDPLQEIIDLQAEDSDSSSDSQPEDLLVDVGLLSDDGTSSDDDDNDGLNLPATDAADTPVMLDASCSRVQGHILLNKHFGLLSRPGLANYVSSRPASFFQRITARFAGASIPLLYPEGMLFPSIFWKSLPDGSVVGAIPHCLWNTPSACKKAGFADLADHIRTRILDPTLLTSTDPRVIQFYFDSLFNRELSHSDTRVVLSRGWEHLSSDPSTFQTLQTEGRLPFGEADSRTRVNELAAEIAHEQPTYFYTHSCNQSQHFGVKYIFNWVEEHYANSSPEEYNSAVQAALVPILRAWERAGTYLMRYIENSPEQPLGPVKKIWWRWEFQTSRGNLPHIHALVWTGEDSESPIVRSRVKSRVAHCFAEVDSFIQSGLIADQYEAYKLQELAAQVHEHNCEKCGYRCNKKRNSDGKMVCRFPKRPQSFSYSTETIHVEHSKPALEILRGCGLAVVGILPSNRSGLVVTEELRARKHTYPAMTQEHFSPMCDWIFAAAKSSDNLQICSPTFTARYLAKYAAGEEERARVFLKASRTSETVQVDQEALRNVKVTGAAIAASSDKCKERKSTAIEGRTLSLTEAVWWLLNFPYVHLCSKYIHINTGFKQDRSGVLKRDRRHVQPGAHGNAVPAVLARRGLALPAVRQFSQYQELTIQDCISSTITPDKISIFGLRPPELLFVDTLVDYFECLVRQSVPNRYRRVGGAVQSASEALLRPDLRESPWIDGLDSQIRILPNKISRVRDLAEAFVNDIARSTPAERNLVQSIIDSVLTPLLNAQPNDELLSRFVAVGDTKPRVAVLSNPLPRYSDRFLIHIILSQGKFRTELDVFSVPHLRRSFQKVGLIDDHANPTLDEKYRILRRYILDQLLYMPGGTVSFDKHLVDADTALHTLLIDGNLQYHSTPLVLRIQLGPVATEDLIRRKVAYRRSFSEALHFLSDPIRDLPSVDDLVHATQQQPLAWEPQINRGRTQTLQSFEEQQRALRMGVDAIDRFRSGEFAFIPAPVLLGPPGSGKSFVTAHWGAYALAKGLSAIVTSVASERAAALGGEHIHLVFSIPVATNLSTRTLAERALTRLARDPVKMHWLKSIQVFIHEEIGTEGAELLDVQNKILQFIHNSSLPFGGVLIMGSGDPNQLPPIDQTLLWTTPSIITTMRLFALEHFVRSSTDQQLQEVLTLFQKLDPTDQDIERIQDLVRTRCTFLQSWDQAPVDALQIFGRRQAEQEAIKRQLDRVHANNAVNKVVVEAVDQYTLDGGHTWIPLGQERIRNKMDRKLQAPRSLTLFVGAVMRFTCNDNPSRRSFHQSQLCVVRELPVDGGSLSLMVAPPGRRTVPDDEQAFEREGWTELRVSKIFTIPERLEGTMLVKREQYPLRHYIASTIHKIMGDTLGMVATQISIHESPYKLWLKSQLYVIISRVRDMSNIFFVGSRAETMEAIAVLLRQSTQWDAYVRHVVNILTTAGQEENAPLPQVVNFHHRPFRPRDIPVPHDIAGYIYLIVSIKEPQVSYIGQTRRLARRLENHNKGHKGAAFTRLPHLRPWGVLAYVVGFDHTTDKAYNRRCREQVEHAWDYTSRRFHRSPTPQQVLDSWETTYNNQLRHQYPNLVLVQCGDI